MIRFGSMLHTDESYLQVESIVLSIISMLSSPNDESPANIDAAVGHQYVFFSLILIFLYSV